MTVVGYTTLPNAGTLRSLGSAAHRKRGYPALEHPRGVRKRGYPAHFQPHCVIGTRVPRLHGGNFHEVAGNPPSKFHPRFETGGYPAITDAPGTITRGYPAS